MDNDQSTLRPGEFHPSAPSAMRYIQGLGFEKLNILMESFSSCAIEGNRLAEICSGTLNRILKGEPVSDRYVLGLAWTIQNLNIGEQETDEEIS